MKSEFQQRKLGPYAFTLVQETLTEQFGIISGRKITRAVCESEILTCAV